MQPAGQHLVVDVAQVTVQHIGPGDQSGLPGDGGRGVGVITGDDDGPHTGGPQRGDRLTHPLTQGVFERGEAQELQLPLGLVAARWCGGVVSAGEADHAGAAAGQLAQLLHRLVRRGGGEVASAQHRLRGAADRDLDPVIAAPDAGDQLANRIERVTDYRLADDPHPGPFGRGGQFGFHRFAGGCRAGPRGWLGAQRRGQHVRCGAGDLDEPQLVLSQGAGLVGDHHGRRTDRFPGLEAPQQRTPAGQLPAADGQQHGNQDRQFLRNGRERDGEAFQEHVLQRPAGQQADHRNEHAGRDRGDEYDRASSRSDFCSGVTGSRSVAASLPS